MSHISMLIAHVLFLQQALHERAGSEDGDGMATPILASA
jgi:hypothetical protein